MSEPKNIRFKRLAIKRTNRVIDQIRILGNLGNKSYYSYTEKEIKTMFGAIEEQLRIIKSKFKSRPKKFFL